MNEKMYDVLVIGGGPCGLACAIATEKVGLSTLVVEKGAIAESIRKYPRQMTFFSTPENIAIGGLPFPTVQAKASRTEALEFYRLAADFYQLDLQLFTTVTEARREKDRFLVKTNTGETFAARFLVLATGYFDFPRPLAIPGMDLPQVSRYYDEAHPYARRRVTIIGGGNSATEAALDLYRHGAEVTLLVRETGMKPTVKYWLTQDIQNRIRDGKIRLITEVETTQITPQAVHYREIASGNTHKLPTDAVLALIGYLPDTSLFSQLSIPFDQESLIPKYDPETFATPITGLYLSGTVVAGVHTEKVFIENGRLHGAAIAKDIIAQSAKD